MKNIYIILGYGIPKNIFQDENYNFYLKIVLNRLHDFSASSNIKDNYIIFSGGKTDCFKPYKRNEAQEMSRLWKKINTKSRVKNCPIILEKYSLSTLEELLFSKDIIKKKGLSMPNICIFCEQTRKDKTKKLAKKIFGKNYSIKIESVDFDISNNRYLDPKFIYEKERKDLNLALWALKNEQNMSKYHRLLTNRIKYLRKAGSKNHVKAVQKWWEEELNNFKN